MYVSYIEIVYHSSFQNNPELFEKITKDADNCKESPMEMAELMVS